MLNITQTNTLKKYAAEVQRRQNEPGGAMGFPRTQANPAEVKTTLLTHHMVAASIFLYSWVALGTFLHIDTYMLSNTRRNTCPSTWINDVSTDWCSIDNINLGIGSNPVGRFTVIVTFLDPLLQPLALDRVVPVLATRKAVVWHAHISCQLIYLFFCHTLGTATG